jgi:hypothetical protein
MAHGPMKIRLWPKAQVFHPLTMSLELNNIHLGMNPLVPHNLFYDLIHIRFYIEKCTCILRNMCPLTNMHFYNIVH